MPEPDHPVFDPVEILRERFVDAMRGLDGVDADEALDPLIGPSKRAELGDFQANAAMPLGKKLGKPPREVAQEIIDRVDLSGIAEPVSADSIAGPGFINIKLLDESLDGLLSALDTPELGLPAPTEPRTVVVDVCGVNLAKQMHVGHLRATVIGDTIARVFERLGWRAVRQNHVGDWGLPIAMVTRKLMQEADAGRLDLEKLDLSTLDALYKLAQGECKADRVGLAVAQKYGMGPKIEAEIEAQVAEANEHLEKAKATLVRLQSGDEEVVAYWKRIYDVTMSACMAACARLHTRITAEDSAGESSYRDELAGVVDDLASRGIAEESDGALVVRVEGISEPCLIRKRDGGFLYATTDLAAIRRRVQRIGAGRVVYVVDARQALHFKQAFGAAEKAGYTTNDAGPASLEHAAFGMVLGEDRRPFKTRSGENVRLSALIEEAVTRARREVDARSGELPEDERASIAEAVGVAAVKYTDLSNDRIKDYVFSFDRMVAFEGDTGPYLLYAVVRIKSIFRKLKDAGLGYEPGAFHITEPAEKALVLELLRYPSVVEQVGEHLEPHRLCGYLFGLAGAFSSFFDACPVIKAGSDEQRNARLRLCDLTLRVLTDGLDTLGIPHVDRM